MRHNKVATRPSGQTSVKAVSTASPRSPISHAHETFSDVHVISDRIIGLATKLSGHVPAPIDDAADVPQSILGELDSGAYRADNSISRIKEALDSIESVLP